MAGRGGGGGGGEQSSEGEVNECTCARSIDQGALKFQDPEYAVNTKPRLNSKRYVRVLPTVNLSNGSNGLPPHTTESALDIPRSLYYRGTLYCSCGLLATGDYVTDQRHGIDDWLLLGSMVAVLNIVIRLRPCMP